MGQNEQRFWKRRFEKIGGIRAVGRRDFSVATNRRQYAEAAEVFSDMVKKDLPMAQRREVLDLGSGLGHYAHLCKKLGFASYVGLDFASKAKPKLGLGYAFRHQDIGESFDLGRRFDLVLAIDVIYHLLTEEEFDTCLDNMRKHARRWIYVTGLFDGFHVAHCWHRKLGRFESLGRFVDMRPWRDNKIVRFAVD